MKDTLMTALWSGVSPPHTLSTGADPKVIFDVSHLQRWGTLRHRTVACPWALRVLSHCCQLLNAKLSQSPRLCDCVDTWRHCGILPPSSACHRTTVTLLWVLRRETSAKKGSEEKGFLTSHTGQTGLRQQCTVKRHCNAAISPSRPYTLTTSQVSLPIHPLSPRCRKSFLHTYNGK